MGNNFYYSFNYNCTSNYNSRLKLTCRSIKYINDLTVVNDESILVVDSGCDQSIVSNLVFKIGCRTGVFFDVNGALSGMKGELPLEVVNNCITTCVLPNKIRVLLVINQALLDLNPTNLESLLQPHQARAYGVVVNDVAARHLATKQKQGCQKFSRRWKILTPKFRWVEMLF